MVGMNGYFVQCLKTRTPDLWGECNNIHLSIVLCDWPVGLPLSWRLGEGLEVEVGGCGGYMLVTMETHVPLNQRENPPPPPDSSVVCTYKIAGTLTYENSLPLYV